MCCGSSIACAQQAWAQWAAGVILRELLPYVTLKQAPASTCATTLLAALAPLIRSACDGLRVLDLLRLLEPLETWLEITTQEEAGKLMRSSRPLF